MIALVTGISSEKNVKCVLCGNVGHIGRDCTETVCILCLEKGHVMDQCADIMPEEVTSCNIDIVILENIKKETGKVIDLTAKLNEATTVEKENMRSSKKKTPSYNTPPFKPLVRLKSLDELLDNNNIDRSSAASDEDSVTSNEKFKSSDRRSNQSDEEDKIRQEGKFHIEMVRKFRYFTPPDVIDLFKTNYCGLCCIKFSGEEFTWRHYHGWRHESLIKKKTFMNKPLYWQMIFHSLISVEPSGCSKQSIYTYIEDTFSAHLPRDQKLVRDNIDVTLQDMVERFHNVVNINLTGVYKLRDRRPSDRPKDRPMGCKDRDIKMNQPMLYQYQNNDLGGRGRNIFDEEDRKYFSRNGGSISPDEGYRGSRSYDTRSYGSSRSPEDRRRYRSRSPRR